MRFDTLAVHAGAEPDPETGALAPPIHLSTTFEHSPDNRSAGFTYQRENNPTQARLETALAALDGGARALFFTTGMAAGAAALQALAPGSHVLFQDDLYHGYRSLARDYLPRWGLTASTVDMTDVNAVRAALRPETQLVWTESPSNPLLKIVDIAAIAEIAHSADAQLLVDGTFAPPCVQRPLALGADVVLHSATKYLGGHSDVMGGVLVFRDDGAFADAARSARSLIGYSASPFAAWLILRGLRSLPARMERHERNARAIAEFLATHANVEAVHYPGLPSHPQYAIATRQMRGFGGMLSLRVHGGRDAAIAAAGKMRIFTNATSLGGCESLVEHRASVEGAHAVSPPNLLRLSIGLEDADDLIDDLRQSLG